MPDTPAHIRPFSINDVLERLRNREIDQAQALNLIVSLGGSAAEAQELIRRVITSRSGAGDIIEPPPSASGGAPKPAPQPIAPPPDVPRGTNPNDFFLEEASRTRAGRSALFNRFNASQFGDLPSRFRRVIDAQFEPLNATFVLGEAARPNQTGSSDFRSFLGGDPRGFDQAGFTQAFDDISSLFDPGQNLSIPDEERRDFFDEGNVAQNIIQQFFGAGGNPLFRNTRRSIVGNRLNSFRDVNPGIGGAELFAAFLKNRGLQGGGF